MLPSLPIFGWFVLGCVEADFCDKQFLLQHLYSSMRFAHYCTDRVQRLHTFSLGFLGGFSRLLSAWIPTLALIHTLQKQRLHRSAEALPATELLSQGVQATVRPSGASGRACVLFFSFNNQIVFYVLMSLLIFNLFKDAK